MVQVTQFRMLSNPNINRIQNCVKSWVYVWKAWGKTVIKPNTLHFPLIAILMCTFQLKLYCQNYDLNSLLDFKLVIFQY